MTDNGSEDRHPFVSLLYLLILCVTGSLIFTFIAVIVCFIIYGNDALTAITGGTTDTTILRIIQSFSSLGTFIIPSVFFAKLESSQPVEFLNFKKKTDLKLVLLASVIVFTASPFIEWTIKINELLELPNALAGIENWMKSQELRLEQLTKQLLKMEDISDLLLNLLIIAIIPAIGEELLFRGCLQKIFIRWTSNAHFGIWIAAIIFSAIHMQFYGFLPRMLLGALFGYLFYWSKNLLIPIIAHFINNGTAVIGAFSLQQKGKSIEMLNKQEDISVPMTIISFCLTVLFSFLFYNWVIKSKDSIHEK